MHSAAVSVSAADRHNAGTNALGVMPHSPLRTARQIAKPTTSATAIGVDQRGAIGSISHV